MFVILELKLFLSVAQTGHEVKHKLLKKNVAHWGQCCIKGGCTLAATSVYWKYNIFFSLERNGSLVRQCFQFFLYKNESLIKISVFTVLTYFFFSHSSYVHLYHAYDS